MKTLLKIIKHPWLFIKWALIKNGWEPVNYLGTVIGEADRDPSVLIGEVIIKHYPSKDMTFRIKGVHTTKYPVTSLDKKEINFRLHFLGYLGHTPVKYTTFEEYLSIYCKPFYSQ